MYIFAANEVGMVFWEKQWEKSSLLKSKEMWTSFSDINNIFFNTEFSSTLIISKE